MGKIESFAINNKWIVSFSAGVLLWLCSATVSHAATIPVAAGADTTNVDATCSLSEAITNINNGDATSYPECDSTNADPFGTNDTIQLPTGTITLTADLPQITESITIRGEGMGESVVDGDGAYLGINLRANPATVTDLTVTGIYQGGINSSGGDVTLRRIEVDGEDAAVGGGNTVLTGLAVTSQNATSDLNAIISDIYIHDFSVEVDQVLALGVVPIGVNGITVDISNVTITGIANSKATSPNQAIGIITGAGMFDNGATAAPISATISNVTISNVTATSGATYGLASSVMTDDSNAVSSDIRNVTIADLSPGGVGFLGNNGSAILAFGAAQVEAITDLSMANVLLAGNDTPNCVVQDTSSPFGFAGVATFNISSLGGNLSDDNSCASYFTHASDQNNVAALADTLLPLAFNGGYVPTMALKQGSPAIDAGITVAGLTADARGVVRPQGLAYDAGAYESPYTRAINATNDDQLASTGERVVLFAVIGLGLVAISLAGLSVARRRK